MLATMLLGALFTGCRTAGYYRQAVRGQWYILAYREPLKDLLADPDTPPELRTQFALVLKLRDFADRELHLPANGHYLSFVKLRRAHAVWNVNAAPEFSVEAKRWWYPVVGRLKYRGYFAEQDAQHYAAHLQQQGFDVFVHGVDAYSTLGWFKDPVLSTFVRYPEPDLAGVIFHELAHQKLFAGGDTDFNEAFASAVEEEGVRRWLKATGDAGAARAYDAAVRREWDFAALVTATRGKLEHLYTNAPAVDASGAAAVLPAQRQETRRRKAAIFEAMQAEYLQLKQRWGGDPHYDPWFAQPLNNAQLNTVDTYHRLMPGFRRLLDDEHGDLPAFYAAARQLAKLPKEQRHHRLTQVR